MAIDVQALIVALEAEYAANQATLAAAGGRTSFSDQGRSEAKDLRWLMDRQKDIAQQLAALGAPIGGIGVPFVISTRVRP